ncbi:MAG: enoyl-CoA hydratase [Polaromonas sp.]|nr:enoyl-CoA hydratase [Polaromonas sp.]
MTQTTEARVNVAVDNIGVAWLTLDNLRKFNAIAPPMWRTISDALTRFESDPGVRCVVLTGQGDKAFCVGADISQFEKIRSDMQASAEYERLTQSTLHQLQSFPKPTVAMIAGYCLGAGVALAAACDLRVAAVGARLGIPAAKLGIGYPYAGVKRLTDLVGPANVKRILFTGERFDAGEMLRVGLVDELVPAHELTARVQGVAAGIAANAPLTILAAKYAVETACAERGERDIAGCNARVKACIESEDHVEGRRAFMEKRVPIFRGR